MILSTIIWIFLNCKFYNINKIYKLLIHNRNIKWIQTSNNNILICLNNICKPFNQIKPIANHSKITNLVIIVAVIIILHRIINFYCLKMWFLLNMYNF